MLVVGGRNPGVGKSWVQHYQAAGDHQAGKGPARKHALCAIVPLRASDLELLAIRRSRLRTTDGVYDASNIAGEGAIDPKQSGGKIEFLHLQLVADLAFLAAIGRQGLAGIDYDGGAAIDTRDVRRLQALGKRPVNRHITSWLVNDASRRTDPLIDVPPGDARTEVIRRS